MPHMVIFRTADGKPSYHQAEVLNEAIRFVEHLRNEELVNDARIFAMAEVPIEFKVQWRVELAPPPPPVVQVPVVAPAEASAADEPEMAEVVAYDVPTEERADAEPAEYSELAPYDGVQTPDEVGVAAGTGTGTGTSGASLPAASSSRFGLFNRG